MASDHTTSIQNEQEEENFNLVEFGFLILKHWQWIVLSVSVALCVGALAILCATPTYRKTTQLLIKSEDRKGGQAGSLSDDLANLGIIGNMSNINNEIQTISAPVLMQEVVKRLHLDVQMEQDNGLRRVPLYDHSPVTLLMPHTPDEAYCTFKMRLRKDRTAELWDFETADGETDKHITVKMGTFAKTPVGVVVIQPTEDWRNTFNEEVVYVSKLPQQAVGNYYNTRLEVALSDKESTILNLTMTDESKQRATDILYKLIEVYNEQWLKDRNRVAESTFEFITERLNVLSKELGDVDQKISDYKSRTHIPDAEAASAQYMTQSAKNNDQILTLNNQLGVARYVREYLNTGKQGQYLPTNTGIGSTGIEKMIDDYNKTVTTRNDLLNNSSESSPLVQKINSEIALKKQTITHSLDNLIEQLQTQVNNWESTEEKNSAKLASTPQQVKQLLAIGRQQKVKETLYIYLLQKREENELSKTFTAWNTRIIQPPIGSKHPSSPRRSIILLISLVAGLALPIAVLYLSETLNHTVRSRADLEGMKIPFIGELPAIGKHHSLRRSKRDVVRKVYVQENCRDMINEAFRILRTKLNYFMHNVEGDSRVIMLTSLNAGAGKSLTALNLAKALSLQNKRVLAVDLDLRHASLSQAAGVTGNKGVSSFLGCITDDVDELVHADAIGANADVLSVGIIPPNPTELLANGKLTELIEKLRNSYDYIILDCPPVEIVADTAIVKDCADVTLFVIRAGLMDKRLLGEVDNLYTSNSYNRMALLLNGVPHTGSSYGGYRYGYRYGGYRYGYAYGKSYYGGDES